MSESYMYQRLAYSRGEAGEEERDGTMGESVREQMVKS